MTVAAGGSVLKGQLDLAGLPEGDYTMVASLKLGGRSIERSAAISMAGLQRDAGAGFGRRARPTG